MHVAKTLLALSVIAGPALGQEQAAFQPAPGFTLAVEAAADGQFVREYVAEGDTPEAWSEMQSHQRYPNLAGQNPVEYLRIVAGDILAVCPEAGFRVANGRVAGGYPNAALYGRCPAPEPETFVIVAISGDAALHVVQHSWRGVPDEAAFADRLAALQDIPLCQAARNPEPCP